jgi:hypothetical protein
MHNIDRTLQESGAIGYEFEQEFETGSNHEQGHEFEQEFGNEFEFEQEANHEFGHEFELESNQEQHELEMTYELMTVTNEMELNQFLGGLMSKAIGAAKGAANSFVRSKTGQGVGNYLVNFGKNTLPQLAPKIGSFAGGAAGGYAGKEAGQALGGLFSPLGAAIGGAMGGAAGKVAGNYAGQKAGTWAGPKVGNFIADKAKQIFNLEFENMSHEDREFEIARSFVRFATDLTRRANNVVSRNPNIPLSSLANQVITQSATQFAPGLLASRGGITRSRSGNWVRRGNSIVIYGV